MIWIQYGKHQTGQIVENDRIWDMTVWVLVLETIKPKCASRVISNF